MSFLRKGVIFFTNNHIKTKQNQNNVLYFLH